MRKIDRVAELDFWEEYKKRHPGIRYGDLRNLNDGTDIIKMLRENLVISQKGLCAYCCCRITPEKSQNEHIYPQSRYPEKSMEYSNIVAGCVCDGKAETCGTAKENFYDEKMFVSPLQDDCESHFSFSPSGEIFGNTEMGKYTIELLNLNAYSLRNARKAQLKNATAYQNEKDFTEVFFPSDSDVLEPYLDIVEYFYRIQYFRFENDNI